MRRNTFMRQALRENREGLTTAQIAEMLSMKQSNAVHLLKRMPDTYIKSWIVKEGRPAAVWAVVVPPPNARCPEKKLK